MKPIRVAALTGGKNVPSARFRVRQNIRYLSEHGVHVTEFASGPGVYPPRQKWLRPLWAAVSLFDRIPGIMASHAYDVTFLQREFISTFSTLENLTGKPRILDIDDAIWIYREGKFIRNIAKECDLVICGNQFIQSYFDSLGVKTCVVPTAIDTELYVPRFHEPNDNCVLVWSGTSGGFKYLYEMESVFEQVFQEFPNVLLRVLADRPPEFQSLPVARVDFVKWSLENEVPTLQDADIGLMPIDDSELSRGKCSFKMLACMSCGLPVLVSDYGMNTEVLSKGRSGYGAKSKDEWLEGIRQLVTNPDLRISMGKKGREIVESNYSSRVIAAQLTSAIRGVLGL